MPSCVSTSDHALVSYDMNRLQGLPSTRPHIVTLNATDRIDPDQVLARMTYEHPIYTAASLKAQRQLPELNGTGWLLPAPIMAGVSMKMAADRAWRRQRRWGWTGDVPCYYKNESFAPTMPSMGRLPALYAAKVTHSRRAPMANHFRYRASYWLVDYDHLPEQARIHRDVCSIRSRVITAMHGLFWPSMAWWRTGLSCWPWPARSDTSSIPSACSGVTTRPEYGSRSWSKCTTPMADVTPICFSPMRTDEPKWTKRSTCPRSIPSMATMTFE